LPDDKVSQLKTGTLRWRRNGADLLARHWRGFSLALGKSVPLARSRTFLSAMSKRPWRGFSLPLGKSLWPSAALPSTIGITQWRAAWPHASIAIQRILLAIGAGALIGLYAAGVYACFVLAQETFSGDWQTIHDIEAAKVFFPTLAAIIAGPLFVWRVFIAHWQAQALRQAAEAERARHYGDLFSRAVEQLGARHDISEVVEISDGVGGAKKQTLTRTEADLEHRLGAIYSLERIARDSAQDYWPVMEVLCAYLRNPQNNEAARTFAATEDRIIDYLKWLESLPLPRADVQTAIDVIGRRRARVVNEARQLNFLDLRETNLQKANFFAGRFSFALFTGAHLESAVFMDSHLEGASFLAAKLDDASFEGAHLDAASLFEADLRRVRNLTAQQIASAIGDASVRLPFKVEWPAHWPKKNLTWEERQSWMHETRKAITARMAA
jgi:hypothetical protein